MGGGDGTAAKIFGVFKSIRGSYCLLSVVDALLVQLVDFGLGLGEETNLIDDRAGENVILKHVTKSFVSWLGLLMGMQDAIMELLWAN